MYVINKNLNSLIEYKKSKFYTYIFYAENKEDVSRYLREIHDKHLDARHILYCYLLSDNQMEATENKEPIDSMHKCLKLLEKKDLKNILCIVARYFGGTLLGASNLDRIYVSCIFDLLVDQNIEEYVTYKYFIGKGKTSYFDIVNKIILNNNGKLISKQFNGIDFEIKFQLKENIPSLSRYIDIKEISGL